MQYLAKTQQSEILILRIQIVLYSSEQFKHCLVLECLVSHSMRWCSKSWFIFNWGYSAAENILTMTFTSISMGILQDRHISLCTQEVWNSNPSYAVSVLKSKLKNTSENWTQQFSFLNDGQWAVTNDHTASLVYLNVLSIPIPSSLFLGQFRWLSLIEKK